VNSSLRPKIVEHRCVGCGKTYPHSFTTLCACGAMIEVSYNLEGATLYPSANSYERYFDLLPLEQPGSLPAQRQPILPAHHAAALGKCLGLPHLYFKDETKLPTRTTKDRMAQIVLSFFREVGVTEFSTSSTGNSSTALAHAIRDYPGCRMYLFTGEDFLGRLNFGENENVILFALRGATFVEAFAEAAEFAKRRNIPSERGFFNPARREGLKIAYLEAAESIPRPVDWYVQAVSSAMGVYGTYKGARELRAMGRVARLPRLLCVQQETCAPMVRAFEAGSEVIRPQDIVERPVGIASAILRGDPSRVYPYVRKIVLESEGTFTAVSESEIREACKMVEELEGIQPCFTASSAVAGVVKLAQSGRIPSAHTVMINLTGGDRPPQPPARHVHWLQRTSSGWQPEGNTDSYA
jgi:threonine synthase